LTFFLKVLYMMVRWSTTTTSFSATRSSACSRCAGSW